MADHDAGNGDDGNGDDQGEHTGRDEKRLVPRTIVFPGPKLLEHGVTKYITEDSLPNIDVHILEGDGSHGSEPGKVYMRFVDRKTGKYLEQINHASCPDPQDPNCP